MCEISKHLQQQIIDMSQEGGLLDCYHICGVSSKCAAYLLQEHAWFADAADQAAADVRFDLTSLCHVDVWSPGCEIFIAAKISFSAVCRFPVATSARTPKMFTARGWRFAYRKTQWTLCWCRVAGAVLQWQHETAVTAVRRDSSDTRARIWQWQCSHNHHGRL